MTTRTAVITGAGQGMGRAIALRFAAGGIKPVLLGRTESKLHAVAEEVAALGGNASVHALDVTDDAAVAELGAALSRERRSTCLSIAPATG